LPNDEKRIFFSHALEFVRGGPLDFDFESTDLDPRQMRKGIRHHPSVRLEPCNVSSIAVGRVEVDSGLQHGLLELCPIRP
jgi:hypothetical protein